MPPFSGFAGAAKPPVKSDPYIVTINVGGEIFQTTKQTLAMAGPNSMLSAIANSSSSEQLDAPFIDRDPELFSVILTLLRTGNLLSSISNSFDLHDVISEARFYKLESVLVDSLSNPSHFDALDLHKSAALRLNGRDSPSAVATTPFGSLHVAHGSKITSFDWSLRRKSTILTQFAAVDSLLALSPTLAAAGATDFSGLQIIDLKAGVVEQHLNWDNPTRSSSNVQAIGRSPEFLFVGFESERRNSNVIVAYDATTTSTIRSAFEIAHNEIYGAEISSAAPATKLTWLSGPNLLMASGSHSGPNGITGAIKLWDVKSGKLAWELDERADCFADVTAMDGTTSNVFKIGVNSGEVYFLDLRKLGFGGQWVCLGDDRKARGERREGLGCRLESHGSRVFCSRDGDLEVWSEVALSRVCDDCVQENVFKRNSMGRRKDRGGDRVIDMGFGGNKMFVTRKDRQCVEVWETGRVV